MKLAIYPDGFPLTPQQLSEKNSNLYPQLVVIAMMIL